MQSASVGAAPERRGRWGIAAAAGACGVLLALPLLHPGWLPWSLPLLLVVVPAAQLALTPVWRAAGVYRYHSPVLFVVERGRDEYELHAGTFYDYLLHLRWADRGARARRALLRHLLAGLLAVIAEIDAGRIPPRARIAASSYVFSERTAVRLGFRVERPGVLDRVHLLLDVLSLAAMYSYVRGRPALPRVWRVRTATTTAAALARRRPQLLTLLARIDARRRESGGDGLSGEGTGTGSCPPVQRARRRPRRR